MEMEVYKDDTDRNAFYPYDAIRVIKIRSMLTSLIFVFHKFLPPNAYHRDLLCIS